jgi:hypothetical protein
MNKIFSRVVAFLFIAIMLLPLFSNQVGATNAPKKAWGKIIEAHCDARYWQYSDGNGSFAVPVAKYFVLAFGRHDVECSVYFKIHFQDGSWVNESQVFDDSTSLFPFKPIARATIQWNKQNVTWARWDVYLSVDGNQMDSEYFVLDHVPL